MARQGLLAQSKPSAATLLYSAPVDTSASAVLKIANDGTGAAYDVSLRDYDQELVLDSANYLLHKGDVISAYRVAIDTAVTAGTFTPGIQFTSSDGEKKMKFESFFIPERTDIFVKATTIRDLSIESITGTFAVGDTITKGVAPDDTTALVVSAPGGGFVSIGPSTINGSGTEFAEGDDVSSSSGGTGTIALGGIGTAVTKFIFSTTTAGGVYDKSIGTDLFGDRVYRFDVSDSSMTGRDFKLSETENGEFGPDGDFTLTGDNGTEYTTGKTTNGTAGSGGAYVQYDLSANQSLPALLYWYDGGTGTASNADYGGPDQFVTTSSDFTYTEFYAYDLEGTWVNSTDTFVNNSITYTVTGQTAGAYGIVSDYDSTTLKVLLGVGSAEFAGTDTFRDVPKDNTATRSVATVGSVTTAKGAISSNDLIADGVTNQANNVDSITSLVIGPGQRVHVSSATQNNVFSLIGFEDASSEFTVRVFGQN